MTGNSCLALLGHQLAVEMSQPFGGWLFYEQCFCLTKGKSCLESRGSFGIFQFFHTSGFKECCWSPLAPRHFVGNEARKDMEKQPRDCLLRYLNTFYFGCLQACLQLWWGHCFWCCCVFSCCVLSLHLPSQSKTIKYQKAKVCVYTFSVCCRL